MVRRIGIQTLGAWLLWFVGLAGLAGAQPRHSEPTGPLSAEQQAEWRLQMRSALFVPDTLPSLEATTHARFEPAPGVVAERLTYQTQFGMQVPAILYLPKLRRAALPGLVVVNGHGGDKYSWYAFYTGVLYAQAGAAVLTYDPIGEGERNSQRASGTRAHDQMLSPREMACRLGGLMVTDVLQAVTYLRQRPEVDSQRIGAMGYSMGSFIVALAGAIDQRFHVCVLVGGGNLDEVGGYWDNSKPMCQGIPYQSLRFLGDRPAAIYALHASRGPTLIVNGELDTVVAIPTHGEDFFRDLLGRTSRLCGMNDEVFDYRLVPNASHRPFFVTRPVALWLERNLDFANWTESDIRQAPVTHISRWAQEQGVAMDPGYASEQREGGTRALGSELPGLSRADLSVFTPRQWEQRRTSLCYEDWVDKARSVVGK